MKFGEKIGEKIEKFYLEILRWLLLIAATVSLVVFFVGLIWSGIYYFSNPPNKPNKSSYISYEKGLSNKIKFSEYKDEIENKIKKEKQIKKDQELLSKEKTAIKKESKEKTAEIVKTEFELIVDESVAKVTINLIEMLNKFNPDRKYDEYDEKEITSIVKSFPDRHTVNADEVIRRYYWEKLLIFIQDYKEDYLKTENPEKNDYEAIFKWYANEVKKEIQAVNDDNELKDDIYDKKVSEHERKVSEHYNNKLQSPLIISVAGGAIGSFVLLIFIFIIVKIERNLRKLD